MVGRLLRVTGTVLVIAAAFVTPVLATSAPASADTVINGCTIVANPTPTNFTNCPGANLGGANLSGIDLSFANLAGARFVDCVPGASSCEPADLSMANLTEANLSTAVFASCGGSFPSIGPCGGVDLAGANLTDANLSSASLFFLLPQLAVADFAGATLTGANLTNTAAVPCCQIAFATSSAGAVVNWFPSFTILGMTLSTCTPPSGSTFPIGTTTVTCQILDDFGNAATGSFTVTVEKESVFPILSSSSPDPSLVGQQVTFTAQVQPTGGGTVSFTDNGSPLPGCSAVPLSGNQFELTATCSNTPGTAGAHNIVASFSGFGIFAGGQSGRYTQLVTRTPCGTLAGCNLQGLNLTAAFFSGQPLSTNLQGANLKGANLTFGFLAGANLTGANMSRANLTSANLIGATLSGANLSRVVWSNTACPDGTESQYDGGTCVGHL
jgi:uncharacterized protein YjbI with pentapeptide repeats